MIITDGRIHSYEFRRMDGLPASAPQRLPPVVDVLAPADQSERLPEGFLRDRFGKPDGSEHLFWRFQEIGETQDRVAESMIVDCREAQADLIDVDVAGLLSAACRPDACFQPAVDRRIEVADTDDDVLD